ncbi:MAG: hypothetical protein IKR74_05105 [Bacilli bacterium]|nr:hypothetical protein [Bacilli bacterium]
MSDNELTQEQLEQIKAGIKNATTKEELEQLKKQVESIPRDEEIDLTNVNGGQPLSYEEAKKSFEENFGTEKR